MLVNLKRGWFAPNGSCYKPADNPHDMPGSWKELLPSTASVVAAPVVEDVEEEAPKTKK